MPPRNASKKAKQAVVVAPDQAQVPAPQPPPPPTRFDQEATAAASAVVAVAPSPPPDNDNDNVNAFVMLTSPGRRYLVNFDDMHTHMGRVLGLFQEYEGELQTELSSLGELTQEFRASRSHSKEILKRGKRRLLAMKSALEEISSLVDGDDDEDDNDGDNEGEENGNDPFGDADSVAGRSAGVFSDPELSL